MAATVIQFPGTERIPQRGRRRSAPNVAHGQHLPPSFLRTLETLASYNPDSITVLEWTAESMLETYARSGA